MLKLASSDGSVIWAILVVVFALVKGLSRLAKPADDDPPALDEKPPVSRPPVPPRQRSRPQPLAETGRRNERPVRRPASSKAAPRPIATPMRKAPRIDNDQIRQFVERLTRQPARPTATPPPIAIVEPVSAPQAVPAEAKQVPDATPAASFSTRGSQWTEALRDRQNIRNIIISAEIIGPPRSISM